MFGTHDIGATEQNKNAKGIHSISISLLWGYKPAIEKYG